MTTEKKREEIDINIGVDNQWFISGDLHVRLKAQPGFFYEVTVSDEMDILFEMTTNWGRAKGVFDGFLKLARSGNLLVEDFDPKSEGGF